MKKETSSKLKKKCDELTSKIIRSLGYCELAGLDTIRCNGNLQTMHILGRSNMFLRFDKQNLLCGCAGHHFYYTNHPWEWQELIRTQFPDRYTYIEQNRLQEAHRKISDYAELRDILQKELTELS